MPEVYDMIKWFFIFNIMLGVVNGFYTYSYISPNPDFNEFQSESDQGLKELGTYPSNAQDVEDQSTWGIAQTKSTGITTKFSKYVFGFPWLIDTYFGLHTIANALKAILSFMYLYFGIQILRGVCLGGMKT